MLVRRYWKLSLAVLIVALASVQIASADQVTISGPTVTRDTYVMGSLGVGDPNNGVMYLGNYSTSYTPNRSLVGFDLSAIPTGMTITSATLKLYHWENVTRAIGYEGMFMNETNYYRLNVPWNVSQTNWANRATDTPWNGDNGPTNDGITAAVNPTATVNVAVGTLAPTKYWVDADVTSDVQFFYANPSQNNGWLITGDETYTYETQGSTFGLAWWAITSEGNASFRPQLVVEYAPVPEPGSFVALGSCLTALVGWRSWRRKR